MIRAIVVFIIFILVAGTLFISARAGDVIQHGTVTYGPDVLHVPVELESVDLSLFSGSAGLKKFKLGQPEGYEPGTMVGLDDLSMKIRLGTLTTDHVIIDEIFIERPQLGAQYKKGVMNFQAFTDRLIPAPDEAPTGDTDAEAAPITMTIHKIRVVEPQVTVMTDGLVTLDETLTLETFELENLGTDEEGLTPAEIARHLTDFLYPQIAKAMITTGLSNQVKGLKDKGVSAVKDILKTETGEKVGGLIEGAVGSIFGKSKEKSKEKNKNKNKNKGKDKD